MLAIVIVLTFLAPTYAWYTCEDLDFCNNIRISSNDVTFALTNIQISNQVHGRLVNSQTAETSTFDLYALESDIFRIIIQDDSNSRYTPADEVLSTTPNQVPLTLVSSADGIITISADDIMVYLHTNPFYVEIVRDDEVITELNKYSRLHINSNEDDESISMDITFPQASVAYGIPQHAESLALPTTSPDSLSAYRLFNVDYYGYPVHTREALYGSIPVLYGVGTSVTSGAFWMNSAQTFVDVDNESVDGGVQTLFISEAGALDLFIFAGPTLRDCVRQYTSLTGVTPLPQYFTLGYHQSRYSYMSQDDVLTVVNEFDNNSFPMDAIWLDIDYTDGYKYFTWNYTAFPDPVEMQNSVVATGRKLVAISDPHIKVEEGYFVYDQAFAQDYFVKTIDGNNYEADCWPGLSSWIDYFNPDARDWYGELYLLENFPDSTVNLYIWNDMNEPSVFDVDELTMPGDLSHYGSIQHKEVHNIYGFKQVQATYEGLLKRDTSTRPFILSRSHFAGSQRYSAIWTGDNEPSWDNLRISIPMILTESLAGMSFCGADIGGFTGDVSEELLQRWYQVGAWHPFYRGHSASDTSRREPYLYSEEIQERIRTALRVRYMHIPQWYTLFYEHELTGDPVVRPLSYHYSSDNVLTIDTQWLVGSDIMVAPVLEEGASTISTYFPGDEADFWYSVNDGLIYASGEDYVSITVDMSISPYYYRSGSIIFRIPESVASTEEQHDLGYEMYIVLDADSQATGTLFLDDFESYEYRNGVYEYYRFYYSEDDGLSVEEINRKSSKLDRELVIKRIYICSPQGDLTKIKTVEASIKTYENIISIKNIVSKTNIELKN